MSRDHSTGLGAAGLPHILVRPGVLAVLPGLAVDQGGGILTAPISAGAFAAFPSRCLRRP